MSPTTGRLHLQGYLETSKAVRFSALQKLEGLESAHFEPRRGTRDQARHYCMKPIADCECKACKDERERPTKIEGPFEFGEWEAGGQGRRSDLAEIHKMVKEGKSTKEIVEWAPAQYIRYHNGIDKIRALYATPRTWKTVVTLYYGPTGWGKSHRAFNTSPDAYSKPPCNKWFDYYDGSSDVIIDDFKGWIPYTTLLQTLDAYKCWVESKGGMVNFAPKRLWITTSVLPLNWYKEDTHFSWPEFARRIDEWWVADLGEKYKFLKSCQECFPHSCPLHVEKCLNKN